MVSCKSRLLLHIYLLLFQSVMVISSTRNINYRPSLPEEHSSPFDEDENVDTGRYKFAYGVEDHKTGDFKVHKEERDGDRVKGEYTVADADGSLRTVKYTADKINGFHVVISRAGNPKQEVIPQHSTLQSRSQTRDSPHRTTSIASSLKPQMASDTRPAYSSSVPIKKYFQEVDRHPHMGPRPTKRSNAWSQKLIFDSAHRHGQEAIGSNVIKGRTTSTPAPYKQWTTSHRAPEFHFQVPHGFKKAEEMTTKCPPVVMQTQAQHSAEQTDDLNDDHIETNSNEDSNSNDGVRYQEYDVEEAEWKKDNNEAQQAAEAANNRQINSFRNLYDMHIAQLGRPNHNNNQGAFSYMNYEGETSSSYELQHDGHSKRKKNSDYEEFIEK